MRAAIYLRYYFAAPLICALAVILTGCSPPPEADVLPGARSMAMERPELVPTSSFDTLMHRSVPKKDAMKQDTSSLSGRAADLSARAARLSRPVIGAEEKARLEAAVSGE